MALHFILRPETPADIPAICEVTQAAFKTLEISNQTEHLVVNALRDAGCLTLSLVADQNGRVIGHIAFSPITISDGTQNWFGLGPVSVLPAYQRQGVGKALINEGLTQLKNIGAQGCCLVGHPEYYTQFGFKNSTQIFYPGVPSEAFFCLAFNERNPHGEVSFHDAFKVTE